MSAKSKGQLLYEANMDIQKQAAEITRLQQALYEAGRNVYQGETSGGWIDHGPLCELGLGDKPCTCGLSEWIRKYAADLHLTLPKSS